MRTADRLGADLGGRDAGDLHRLRQEGVPRWMAGKGRGWLTAEYGMLPASTGERKQRDITQGRLDGRTVEIQRLIGRSLRGVIDFAQLGERTIYLDCDVLQADGGTRCASITGAYVALALACATLRAEGKLERSPLTGSVAAVSCGIVDGVALLDLDYSEDSTAEVDANVVMTGEGGLIEVQATAERTPLSRAHLDELLALAGDGIEQLREVQAQAIALRREARAGDPQRAQAREFARMLAALTSVELLPDEVGAAARGRGDVRGERARQGARGAARDGRGQRSPTTPGSRRRRSAARRGCARRATPASEASDEENLAKLLREAPAGSALAYVCALAYVDPASGVERVFEGRCAGALAAEPRGAGGFGYDPAFLPDDGPARRALTMAELSDEQKDAISHRGRAARALLEWLAARELSAARSQPSTLRTKQVDRRRDATARPSPA